MSRAWSSRPQSRATPVLPTDRRPATARLFPRSGPRRTEGKVESNVSRRSRPPSRCGARALPVALCNPHPVPGVGIWSIPRPLLTTMEVHSPSPLAGEPNPTVSTRRPRGKKHPGSGTSRLRRNATGIKDQDQGLLGDFRSLPFKRNLRLWAVLGVNCGGVPVPVSRTVDIELVASTSKSRT